MTTVMERGGGYLDNVVELEPIRQQRCSAARAAIEAITADAQLALDAALAAMSPEERAAHEAKQAAVLARNRELFPDLVPQAPK